MGTSFLALEWGQILCLWPKGASLKDEGDMSEFSAVDISLRVDVVRALHTSIGYGKMKRHLKVEIIEKCFCNLNSCEPVQGRAVLSLMSSGQPWLLGHLPGSHSCSPGTALPDSLQAYAEGASCSHWPIPLLKQKAGGPGSIPLAGEDVAQPCKDAPLPDLRAPGEVTNQEVSGGASSTQSTWQQLKLRPRILGGYGQDQNDLIFSRPDVHVLTFVDFLL